MSKRVIVAFIVGFILAGLAGAFVVQTVAAQRDYDQYTQWQFAVVNITGEQVSLGMGDATDKGIVLDAYNSLDNERRQPFDMVQLMGYIGFELVSVTEQGQKTSFYFKRPMLSDS